MATRKVLINRHTSGNTAPVAADMYKGEIAVQHKTGEEILWTKNNDNVMVPFISCAQTIDIVSGMIESVDVVYKVEKKAGEPYIDVETGGTDHQKVFTLSTSGVASETNLNALSAGTVSNLQSMTEILTALTDVVVTGISGDSIIVAEKVDTSTGSSNSFNLTHKQALATNGFNKLATDAYGHVTASTAVTTADIEALGFKTSADTDADLAELSASVVANETHISELSAGTQHDIQTLSANTHNKIVEVYGSANSYTDAAIASAIDGLDSEKLATDNRHYITAITIEDGKLSTIGEAEIPMLSSASTGDGNVVTDIAVNDHTITFTKGLTVASDADLKALSGAVGSFSAETMAEFTSAFTAINSLSADTEAAINELAGKAVTSVTFNGTEKVANNVATLVETQLSTGTTQGDGNVVTSIAVNNHEITLTKGLTALEEVIAEGDDYIDASVAGNSAITVGTKAAVVDDKDELAAVTATGSLVDAKAVKDYVEDIVSSGVNYRGATDSLPASAETGDLYVASSAFTVGSENVEVGDFIIYDGNKWDVIQKNIDGAITGNLTAGTVTLGNGPHTVGSLENGTNGQVLGVNNGAVAWVDLPVLSSATTGTGNVVTSILVNDHEITYAKDFTAADNAALEALSAGTIQLSGDTKAAIEQLSGFAHSSMIARDDAVFSSAVTYANEKVAAEIAKLDSTGVTSDSGHYLTSVTITDGIISAVGEEEIPAAIPVTTASTTTATTASSVVASVVPGGTDGHQLTLNMTNKVYSAATADEAVKVKSALTINVLDSAGTTASTVTFDGSSNQTIEIPGSHDTATTETGHYAPSTTASSLDAAAGTVLNTITLDSKKHVISAGTTDKINSASTAESADTASKVNNALSISGYASSESSALDSAVSYDGSAAQSLTFGKTTAAGKSMSFSNGVVDVEIIDCGEY